ncbi:MAG: hypothetical protein Q7S20_02290 [Gemmatimonadaceae bacterium]|nr:hypothetical protein [Gemmatimonadaceae bacterium]
MIAAAAAMVMSPSLAARAQLVPNDRWYTIETAHFRVHFTKALEAEARRGAVNGERAFAQLSTELRAPRGKVDLVIADNIDYVNGYATTFPSNRIVVFAHPPIDAPELRNYDDWSQLVITHELTHIFHLDRADGVWRLGRSVFGRHPGLFPNSYQPAWLVEGLAVYYESRITGAGRLEGAEHYMLARSAAEVRRVPRLGELSRATSRFPGGETVYAYGAFVLDYLSRTRGPETIPKFVDITSRLLLPISLNARAKRAFGISFENAWRDWRDSLVRVSGRGTEPLPRWRDLTHDGRYAEYPRWLGDTAIMYVASTGREVASAYSVTLDGKVTRLGRRNALDANSPLPDGSVVFAQPDYIDPFHFRTDLYVENNGEETRLTRGARLTQPDARKDGAVVAVQSVPGSTRIVRVWRDGRPVQPITTGNAEVQWAEPRWSPTGSGIAAIRIRRGGISELVMLDTLGAVIGVPVSQRAVLASPSWFPSGSSLFYTSTISGSTQAYAVAASGQGTESASRGVSAASTGFFNPELSPNERNLSGLSFRFDGYHVGVAPANTSPTAAVMSRARGQREGCRGCRLAAQIAPPLSIGDVGPARRYSPWQSLAPRYWEPLLSHATRTGTAFGAATSGVDVIGRHSLYAEASFNTNYRETSAFGAYQYGGFGQPYLNLSAQQEWEHFSIFNNSGREVGDLARRARIAGLSASFVRPRARTYSSFSLGGELESRTYGTDPDTLLARLPALFAQTHRYPSVFTSASWTNTMRPALSISREDGISVSATARQRWESGDIGSASRSIVGVTAVYKSLDLPGFAHHVIAARAAAGYADSRAISSFSVGGLSGGSLDVLEGLTVGGERRTFGVRGFPPSAEQGIRAFAGSLEYRAPIAAPSKRVPFIPLLFDRISISTFGEAGRAYCPASAGQTQICTAGQRGGLWLASAGTELDFDTALQYDVPARFRLGVAVPVVNRAAGRADAVSVYLTIGSSF